MPAKPSRKGNKPLRSADLATDGDDVELILLHREQKAHAVAELARIVKESGFPHLSPDAWSATYFFWDEVFKNHGDPHHAARFAFGVTDEQMADQTTPFGLAFSRILAALHFKHTRRIGRVLDANYAGALEANGIQDRKLFLQAHLPEKFVPQTRTKVTIDDLRATLEGATDAELAALAGTDTGTGES